jgi:hypothetical protein
MVERETESPYRAPDSNLSKALDPDAEVLGLFVGAGSPASVTYYLRKWEGLRRGTSKWAGVNWAALFFGPVWCFYRRLFWLGGLIYALELLVANLVVLVLAALGQSFDTSGSISPVMVPILLLVRVFGCLAANVIYYRRAVAVIHQMDDHARTPTERRQMIAGAGGVSQFGVAVAIAINLFQQVLARG